MVTIVPIADGEDGGGGQRGPAVQHHLLPLLPSHHCLPGTAGKQVSAQKAFFVFENSPFFLRYLQHLFAEHNIMHEVQSVINRTL